MAEPVPGPLVSVIIPVRNSPHYLRQCLASLGTSRYTNFEVLVVDDGSTDVTPLLAAELGARVVRLQRRAGPAAARNRGAEEARGQYLLFLDADVCVHPDTVGAFRLRIGHPQVTLGREREVGDSVGSQPVARIVVEPPFPQAPE